jgi:hypothetical protein
MTRPDVDQLRDIETDRLAREFIALTLPKNEWTHGAHLRVGLWHVLRFSDADSLDLLRGRIRAYNESTGGVNSESAGYHETITRFYVVVISAFVRSVHRTRPVDDLARELIERFGDRELPLRHYSRARLFSVEARLGWVEPDLLALPGDIEER